MGPFGLQWRRAREELSRTPCSEPVSLHRRGSRRQAHRPAPRLRLRSPAHSRSGSSAPITRSIAAAHRLASVARMRSLIVTICDGCIEKLRRPMPSRSSVNAGSPAISPHTLTSLLETIGAGDRLRDQLQHGRMPGVVEMGDGLVGAIDRERVLDEVVGADRDEVEVAQERRQHQRRRRHLDHRAELDRAVRAAGIVELLTRARQRLDRVAHLAQVRDHRDQDAHPAVRSRRAGSRAAAGETSPAPTGSSGSRAGRAPG